MIRRIAAHLLMFPLCLCIVADIRSAAPPVSVPTPYTTFATAFVVFPADTNAMGTAFGGKLMSEMDRTAAITVRRFLYASPTARDAVTVAVNNLQFRRATAVKDLLIITGTVEAAGEKSVTVAVVVERETADRRRGLLVEGEFVFVAYDPAAKRAVAHGVKLP